MGRPVPALVIDEQQRSQLGAWARRATSSQALALRARIVLRCADGGANGEVADELGVNRATVGKWRQRFVDLGLDGLADAPRPGVPPGASHPAEAAAVNAPQPSASNPASTVPSGNTATEKRIRSPHAAPPAEPSCAASGRYPSPTG